MVLGAGPATDLLSQLELKMQEEVTAYLERMKQVNLAEFASFDTFARPHAWHGCVRLLT